MSTHLFVKDVKRKRLIGMGNTNELNIAYDWDTWKKYMSLIDNMPVLELEEIKINSLTVTVLTRLVSAYKMLVKLTDITCTYKSGLIYCYNNEIDVEKSELVYEGSKEYDKLIKQKWEII